MQKVAEPSRRGGAVTEYLARARVGTRSTCPRGSSRAGQPRVPTATTPGAIGGEPVSEPQFLGEAVSPRAPVTQRCEQVPVPVSARSTAVYPVGGRWPVWCAALAIQLVTRVKLSLRSTPKALEVVLGFLRG